MCSVKYKMQYVIYNTQSVKCKIHKENLYLNKIIE